MTNSLERELDYLVRAFNRADYPLNLVDDAGEAAYTIPARDAIDSVEIVQGDPFISVVMNDENRPWRIRVVEYAREAKTLIEDDGGGGLRSLHIG